MSHVIHTRIIGWTEKKPQRIVAEFMNDKKTKFIMSSAEAGDLSGNVSIEAIHDYAASRLARLKFPLLTLAGTSQWVRGNDGANGYFYTLLAGSKTLQVGNGFCYVYIEKKANSNG